MFKKLKKRIKLAKAWIYISMSEYHTGVCKELMCDGKFHARKSTKYMKKADKLLSETMYEH